MGKKVLVVIDVQTAVVEQGYKLDKTIDNINRLIRCAREQQIPIIYIQHEYPEGPMSKGEPGWQFHPRLEKPQEFIIYKTVPNSFTHTPLKQTLDKLVAKHIYICGAQTEFCVDSTCRGAFDLDYNVTLITDAHTTSDAEHLSAPSIIEHTHRTLKNFWSPNATITLE
ncbi:cysteine hydrolase family protein [Peribacillus sp. NPDC060186]